MKIMKIPDTQQIVVVQAVLVYASVVLVYASVEWKCKETGKILVLGYFSIKQLCGTISVVVMVTVNVFSIRATLVSFI